MRYFSSFSKNSKLNFSETFCFKNIVGFFKNSTFLENRPTILQGIYLWKAMLPPPPIDPMAQMPPEAMGAPNGMGSPPMAPPMPPMGPQGLLGA